MEKLGRLVHRNRQRAFVLVAISLVAGTALAQSSASFKLEEHTFNAGGNPEDGAIPTSPSFRISLDSIGDTVSAAGLTSPSFNLDACFSAAYAPPQEVTELSFVGKQVLEWNPEKSAGTYNLYRSLVSDVNGLGYGTCEQEDITGTATSDIDIPPVGDGFFYLVTAENRLEEEGTKGFQSDSVTEREGTSCP